ncbi:hypothetical protein [Bacillus luti]|nr:hypothetical protein [Bacillus luti]
MKENIILQVQQNRLISVVMETSEDTKRFIETKKYFHMDLIKSAQLF